MQKDPWIFNYRSHCRDDSDSDSDHSFHGSKSNISDESRLRSELDISTRPDAAVFKPNPFSIAKMNAFTRSSRQVVAKPTHVAEKRKNTSPIDVFFRKTQRNAATEDGKTARKKPTVYKKPSTTGSCNPLASSQVVLTNSRFMEKQPSKPPDSCMARHPNSSEKSKTNGPETQSNRPRQVDTAVARHKPDTEHVSSSGGMPHTPIRVCVEQEISHPILSPLSKKASDSTYSKAAYVPSPGTCPHHRVVVRTIRHGEESQPVVPREGSYPIDSACGKQESPLPIISSTKIKETGSVSLKPKYVSGVTSAILPETVARSQHGPQHAPMKRLVNHSKMDSIAHMPTSTVKNPPKCYEAKPDEDESWSTLPPRKKFKPSVQPISKYKMTGPFRIPGLRHDGDVVKTGMSATSSTRVITFLPTPLLPDSHKGRGKAEFESLSSPQSSPQSQRCSSFAEESGSPRVSYSSPPTSDSPEADCDLNIHWDNHHLEKRYAQVPKAIEEV